MMKHSATRRANAAPGKLIGDRIHSRMPEIHEASEKFQEKLEDNRKRLTGIYRNCFQTPDGLIVLKDLVNYCGFLTPSVCASVADGTIDMVGTVHNDAMRKVYLHIREFLDPATLLKVEKNGD